ncbi:MAG: response regulator, partial [Spirochaetia bacterium]|nr:response regulator [Spirochaetia bacterium]
MTAKKLILVADDEPDILSAIKETLEEKFDIITAVNGREAIDMVFSRSPDMVIMDVSMPGMDGFDAVRQLRSKRSPTDPPVIFLSARTQRADVEQG